VLTGRLLTDPSTASGYGCFNLLNSRWEGVPEESPRLPEVVASNTGHPLTAGFAGIVRARPGIPVVLGAADSVLGAYGLGLDGMGADAQGDIAYIAGTSTVILGSLDRFVPDPLQRYLVTPLAGPGFGAEMDLLSTGSAVDWLARLLGSPDAASLVEAAGAVLPDAAPTFLPYLAPGEQGALWSPSLRGTLFGLTLGSTGPEIARGLLNGILLESRRCVRVLDESNPDGSRLLVSGSSAASPVFRQGLADATGRTVFFSPGETDHSAVGAAALAGAGLGWPARSAASGLVRTNPDPDSAGTWEELARKHDDALDGVRAEAARGETFEEGGLS
jgi:xylulokinase